MIELCINSKFLYDQALYVLRQNYFNNNHKLTLSKYDLVKEFRQSNNDFFYKYPTRIGKETLFTTFESFKSFIELDKLYNKNQLHFKPKLPKYLKSRNIHLYQTTFNKEAILGVNNKLLNQLSIDPNYKNLIADYNKYKDTLDIVKLSRTNIYFLLPKSIRNNIKEINIIPKSNHFNIHFVYDKPLSSNTIQNENIETIIDEAIKDNQQEEVKIEVKEKEKDKIYCGIDLGVSNLLTMVFSDGHNPIIIDGGNIKSFNQYYNKELSRLKSRAKKCNNLNTTKRIQQLILKRNDKMDTYFHELTKKLVDYLVSINVDEVIIGKNDGWKQKSKLSKKVNQSFQHIPYAKLINMFDYKLNEYDIKLTTTEESYTSKCSFIDNEVIGKHKYYKGKRVKRGLYKTATGRYINADVNGAYNIIKKVIPIFGWSEALSVKPIKYKLNNKISLISHIINIKDINY